MSNIIDLFFYSYNYYRKYFYYKLSLYLNIIEYYYDPINLSWWNEITDGIILGAIPLKNYNHDDILINKEKVKYILTILDPFEIETITYISEPVKPEDWSAKNITQKIINSSDYEPLKTEDINDGVSFLEECINKLENNEKIYVHCKAGHGRSAIIVIAYMIKNHAMSLEDAHNFVKNKRSTVNLNQQQYDSLTEYYRLIHNNELDN